MKTVKQLHAISRRFDHRNAGVTAVLRAMRDGTNLQMEFHRTGPKWRLSNGRYVKDEVARIVIANKQVWGVGDTLFPDGLSQTFRFVEDI